MLVSMQLTHKSHMVSTLPHNHLFAARLIFCILFVILLSPAYLQFFLSALKCRFIPSFLPCLFCLVTHQSHNMFNFLSYLYKPSPMTFLSVFHLSLIPPSQPFLLINSKDWLIDSFVSTQLLDLFHHPFISPLFCPLQLVNQ